MTPRRGRRPHNFEHTPDLEAARASLVDLRKRSKRLHHFSGGRGYDNMGARELEQLRTKIDEAEFWLSAATRSLNAGGERARRIAEEATHYLVVEEIDGERDYDLRHADDCPTEADDTFAPDGRFYTCDVGQLWAAVGREGIPDAESLAPGTYPVRVHVEHTPSLPTNGGEEWDAWIEVVRG